MGLAQTMTEDLYEELEDVQKKLDLKNNPLLLKLLSDLDEAFGDKVVAEFTNAIEITIAEDHESIECLQGVLRKNGITGEDGDIEWVGNDEWKAQGLPNVEMYPTWGFMQSFEEEAYNSGIGIHFLGVDIATSGKTIAVHGHYDENGTLQFSQVPIAENDPTIH